MDLKSLVPWVKEEMDKGRTKKDIYDEVGLNKYQRQNINAYLRYDEPAKDEVEEYLIIPEHVHEKRYVTFNGKRYVDVTPEFIDCGG